MDIIINKLLLIASDIFVPYNLYADSCAYLLYDVIYQQMSIYYLSPQGSRSKPNNLDLRWE